MAHLALLLAGLLAVAAGQVNQYAKQNIADAFSYDQFLIGHGAANLRYVKQNDAMRKAEWATFANQADLGGTESMNQGSYPFSADSATKYAPTGREQSNLENKQYIAAAFAAVISAATLLVVRMRMRLQLDGQDQLAMELQSQSPAVFAVDPSRSAGDAFVNPNPVLQDALDATPTFKEGKKVVWGVFSEDVDPSSVPSRAEQSARRSEAAAELTNIDDEERARRGKAAIALSIPTVAYIIWLVSTHAGIGSRLTVLPLVFLAYGFYESSRVGL
jgi:hypothetical protein